MNSLLKKLLSVALLTPVLAFAQFKPTDVVVMVADDPITQADVQERINVNLALIQRSGKKAALTKEQQNQLANDSAGELIEEKVMLNQARKLGITTSDFEADAMIEKLAKANGKSVGDFKASIIKQDKEEGWAMFNRDLRTDMTIEALKKKEVFDKVPAPTAAEIEKFLADQKLGASNPIPKGDGIDLFHLSGDKKSMAKMKQAKAALDAGQAFQDVATKFDLTGSPIFIALNDEKVDPVILKAVKDLPNDKISDVVTAKTALHVFQAKGRRTVEFTLEQQQKYATEILTNQKAKTAYTAWTAELAEKAKPTIVWKK
jgi:parvulin-like peptidyl-prolyl isomerase